jgi:hypothetical protein
MSHIFVETQSLRRYDERALGVLYRCIAYLRKKRLTRQEVLSIYEEGIEVVLSGHGLNHAPELNYALFYSKVRMRSPVVLTLKCLAARGESHAEVIQNGDPEKLIVAGTVRNRKFSGVSTTWMKGIQPESGSHSLGLFMNDLLLDFYCIEREPSWIDQDSQIRNFA